MTNISVSMKIDPKDIGTLITAAVRRGHNFDNNNKPTVILKRLLTQILQNKINEMVKES